jgi:IS1 family transposase
MGDCGAEDKSQSDWWLVHNLRYTWKFEFFDCAISKWARKTNPSERFNNTLRQCLARLVREALSFSKKLANHIGAIKLVVCHYNLMRASA